MSEKPSIKNSFVYNLLYQMVSLLTPLITAPYVARVLGVEGVGIYSYTQSIVIYFTMLAGLGSNSHGRREIAASRDSKGEMSRLFYEIMTLRCFTVFVSILLYIGFILIAGADYKYFFALQTIDIVAIIFDITWFYQGIEDFKKTATRQIIVKIVGVFAILAFVKTANDIPIYILCYSIPVLLGNLFLWPGIRNKIGKIRISELNPFRHLKSEIALFIPYIATVLYSYVDKTMLGALSASKVEVGYYSQAFKFISIAVAVVSALADVMVPRIANCYRQEKHGEISALSHRGLQAIFAMSFLIAAELFAVGPNLIPWFLGDEYSKSALLLQILCLLVLIKGANNFCGSALLVATYRQNIYSKCIWITTIFNIVVNAALIPVYGSVGACVATVTSEFMLFALQIFFTRMYINIKDIFALVYKYALAATVVAFVVFIVQSRVIPNALNTIALGLSTCVMYLILLLIMKDEQVLTMLRKVLERFKK